MVRTEAVRYTIIIMKVQWSPSTLEDTLESVPISEVSTIQGMQINYTSKSDRLIDQYRFGRLH